MYSTFSFPNCCNEIIGKLEYRTMKTIEIFAGAGGLALGAAKAGFKHEALLEWDADSCDALRANISRKDWKFGNWKILQGDVRDHSFTSYKNHIDLVSGGPPCQPFSVGGKHKGFEDTRDMFPQAARVVSEVAPKAFVFENVRGLLRESFSEYFDYVIYRLRYPEEVKGKNEPWKEHLARLERIHTGGHYAGLQYRVLHRLLNAANYGIPQKRQRVFIVGFRTDIEEPWAAYSRRHRRTAAMAESLC